MYAQDSQINRFDRHNLCVDLLLPNCEYEKQQKLGRDIHKEVSSLLYAL